MKNLLLGGFLTLVFFGFYSCDPCSDCGPSTTEPEVKVTFFNGDSLAQMQDSLVVVDTLIFAVDSLLIVVDSVQNGGELSDERTALENFIDGLTHLRSTKTDSMVADCLDSLGIVIDDQIDLLASGVTAVDELLHVSAGFVLENLDSADVHYLAMDLAGTESEYEAEIAGSRYQMSFLYEQVDELDEDRNLIRRALLQQITTDFDSVFCICTETDTVDISNIDCLASETTLHAYF